MPPAPSQRDEPVRAHQVDEVGELVIPADQLRNGLRYMCGRKRCWLRLLWTEAGALVAGLRQSPDLPNKLVAASRDRTDQVAVLAQDA